MTAIAYEPDPQMSFWPTPPEVADDLVRRVMNPGFGDGAAAGGVPQVRVLEPSAGDGHLLTAIREYLPGAWVTAVEPSPARAARLREQGLADEVIESTLEDFLCTVAVRALTGTFEPYDLVIMNPPFTLPDRPEAWAEHFLAIQDDPHLLNPWAQISAVVPHTMLTGKSKLVRKIRVTLDPYYGTERCERGAFDPVGARVSTVTIWWQKPNPEEDAWQADRALEGDRQP